MMKQTARSTQGASSGQARRGWAITPPTLVTGCVIAGCVVATSVARAQEAASGEAPSKASCAQAYESAQESRAAGHLQETQTRLSVCARPECPSFVQKDCARWLEEVERELPSVVMQANGLDAEAARSVSVTLDGRPVPDAFAGRPIALDPGRHELVAESPGRSPVSRIIVAQQGVQNRPVTLDFAPEPSAAGADVTLDTGSGASLLRPYAYVAWGAGAVGLGMFAVLGTLGRADERAFKEDCPEQTDNPDLIVPGRVCATSVADERKAIYEREFILADVGLVTGLVGVAAGTVLFILSAGDAPGAADSSDTEAGFRLGISPAPGGGYASVGGVF